MSEVAVLTDFPVGFKYGAFLEDHFYALKWLTMASGHYSPGDRGDEAIVLGAHVGGSPLDGVIAINTERISGFIHGDIDAYLEKLRAAKAVWSLYEDDAEALRDAGVKKSLVWHYGPDVFSQFMPRLAEPEYDFVHIGSLTKRRSAQIVNLREAGFEVIGASHTTFIRKVELLAASRASLALAYDDKCDYLPWPRIVFAASQGLVSLTDVPLCGQWGSEWATVIPRKAAHSCVERATAVSSVVLFNELLKESNS